MRIAAFLWCACVVAPAIAHAFTITETGVDKETQIPYCTGLIESGDTLDGICQSLQRNTALGHAATKTMRAAECREMLLRQAGTSSRSISVGTELRIPHCHNAFTSSCSPAMQEKLRERTGYTPEGVQALITTYCTGSPLTASPRHAARDDQCFIALRPKPGMWVLNKENHATLSYEQYNTCEAAWTRRSRDPQSNMLSTTTAEQILTFKQQLLLGLALLFMPMGVVYGCYELFVRRR